MPSSQVNSVATLESLARPANTIASNLPKQASSKAKQPKAPNPLKTSIPQPTRGGSAKQQLKAAKSMKSVLSGY